MITRNRNFFRSAALFLIATLGVVVLAEDKPRTTMPATQPTLRTIEQIDAETEKETRAAEQAFGTEVSAVRARRIERLQRARDLERDAKRSAALDALLEAENAASATQPTAATRRAESTPAAGKNERLVFVADCTGSMFGTPAFQAQKAFLRERIEALDPGSTFAIAAMGGNAAPLKPAYVLANEQGKRRAVDTIAALDAKGQVAMSAVLVEAFKLRPTTVWLVYQMPDSMETTDAIVKTVRDARRAAKTLTVNVAYVSRGHESDARAIADAGGGEVVTLSER